MGLFLLESRAFADEGGIILLVLDSDRVRGHDSRLNACLCHKVFYLRKEKVDGNQNSRAYSDHIAYLGYIIIRGPFRDYEIETDN